MIRILAVGRLKGQPEEALFARYAARLRPPPSVVEIAESASNPVETRRREGAALLAALPASATAVALDPGGAMPDSIALSAMLARWRDAGRPLCFLIGGAEGLDGVVLDRADAVLSLGRLTWPHRLARCLLAEQLYRAQCLAAGHPYHR